MRAALLFAIVLAVHVVGVGSFIFLQGCGTRRPAVEPPPPPPMPAREAPAPGPGIAAEPPVFQPPVPVEAAPSVLETAPGQTYVVQKGDTLSGIASRYGVRAREIADVNKLANLNSIRVGQKLILPAHARAKPLAAPKPSVSPAAAAPAGGSVHVVQKGDTLSGIAKQYGTSVKALREANRMSGDKILIGQKLALPGSVAAVGAPSVEIAVPELESGPDISASLAEPVPAAPVDVEEMDTGGPKPYLYTVAEGDTLESIARNFVVLKEDLMKANRITQDAPLEPGQKLVIPMPDAL